MLKFHMKGRFVSVDSVLLHVHKLNSFVADLRRLVLVLTVILQIAIRLLQKQKCQTCSKF